MIEVLKEISLAFVLSFLITLFSRFFNSSYLFDVITPNLIPIQIGLLTIIITAFVFVLPLLLKLHDELGDIWSDTEVALEQTISEMLGCILFTLVVLVINGSLYFKEMKDCATVHYLIFTKDMFLIIGLLYPLILVRDVSKSLFSIYKIAKNPDAYK